MVKMRSTSPSQPPAPLPASAVTARDLPEIHRAILANVDEIRSTPRGDQQRLAKLWERAGVLRDQLWSAEAAQQAEEIADVLTWLDGDGPEPDRPAVLVD